METTVFRKTQKGLQEVADRRGGLQLKLPRALIGIDGAKEIAEFSVPMPPSEVEFVLEQLTKRGRTLGIKLLGEKDVSVDALGQERGVPLAGEIGGRLPSWCRAWLN